MVYIERVSRREPTKGEQGAPERTGSIYGCPAPYQSRGATFGGPSWRWPGGARRPTAQGTPPPGGADNSLVNSVINAAHTPLVRLFLPHRKEKTLTNQFSFGTTNHMTLHPNVPGAEASRLCSLHLVEAVELWPGMVECEPCLLAYYGETSEQVATEAHTQAEVDRVAQEYLEQGGEA